MAPPNSTLKLTKTSLTLGFRSLTSGLLARPSQMESDVRTEWWLDESSLPDLAWARVRVFEDGSADVFDCDGRTRRFRSAAEARCSLLEDEYARFESVDRQE